MTHEVVVLILTDLTSVSRDEQIQTKILTGLKQSSIKDFQILCSSATVCPHCQNPRPKIRHENFSKIYFERTGKAQRLLKNKYVWIVLFAFFCFCYHYIILQEFVLMWSVCYRHVA